MKKITSLLLTLLVAVTMVFTTTSFANKQDEKCIIKIAQEDGRFTTLLAALDAAGLIDTLKGEGPFTVFAPTDEAFKKLPAGTVESLLKPENKDTLKDILLYHVAKGKLPAKDVVALNGKELDMANGKKAKIEVKNGEVFIDGAKVIIADIAARNGIIHVIDTVIIPK